MSVTTYTADGIVDMKALLCALVNDLTGEGEPLPGGEAAEHMKLVYPLPEDIDLTDPTALPDSSLIILESTSNIDPFARDNPLVASPNDDKRDPWRIAFHVNSWKARSLVEPAPAGSLPAVGESILPNPVNESSMAIYVGTPSTLYTPADGSDPTIGWITSTKQTSPAYLSAGGGLRPFYYKSSYRGKDLVEPVGNIGAAWTNTFDPTVNSFKFTPPPTGTATSGVPPVLQPYQSPVPWDGPDVTNANQLFINRYITAGAKTASFGGFAADSSYAQPTSYRLVVSDHGLFLGCWGPDPEENGRGFSWVLVQRPVDKKTGIVRGLTSTPIDDISTPGNRPLFCVNSVNGQYWKFVVREHDSPVPSTRKDATGNTDDSGAVINPYQQQSLTENGEYVITFLNNLNSSRFKYADELDMLGTVSSDVVGGGSEIAVNVYSEAEKRNYHALWSSGSFGTKMRIMVVKDIPTANPPE